MKPAPFTYHDPRTLAEAAALLARLEDARLLAGGQSLMPMMNFRLVTPAHLIDLDKVEELRGARPEGAGLRIGAMTCQRDLEISAAIGGDFPILIEALSLVGHRPTRNRGTIGGSLCHLDPAAELVNLAALYEAAFEACSVRGSRPLGFAEFAKGAMTNALAPDELLSAVTLVPWSPRHGWAFEEVSRRHGDFAIVAVGALVELDPGGAVARAAIAVSGLGPLPLRLGAVERDLVGQMPAAAALRLAAEAAGGLEAEGDVYAGAAYRRHLARILTWRALERALARAAERAVK